MGSIEKSFLNSITFTLLITLVCSITCKASETKTRDSVVIISLDSLSQKPLANCKSVDISQVELERIMKITRFAVENYNKSPESDRLGKIEFSDYCVQLVAGVNSQDDVLIYANFVCCSMIHSDDLWKKKLFITNDGGKCFFNLNINLSEKIFYNFRVNGM